MSSPLPNTLVLSTTPMSSLDLATTLLVLGVALDTSVVVPSVSPPPNPHWKQGDLGTTFVLMSFHFNFLSHVYDFYFYFMYTHLVILMDLFSLWLQ